jgi:glycosyltransferase involved in cell wall biosynthesis
MAYLLGSEDAVYRLPEMSREISCSDFKALLKIWRILRRERPQIVHTHTAKAGGLGRVAAWLAGVPVLVHTYHGHVFHGYFSKPKTRFFLEIERLLARITTRIVAISESQRQELSIKYRVAPLDKITVVQNGFHFPTFSQEAREAARHALGYQKDDFVLVWAGRMAPVKDVHLLAEVIGATWASSSPARFLVVGDGEDKPELERCIENCKNVRFLGWQKEMDQVWCAADAAILTSRNEGTPTALIEAMSAGLPFVSTNVGGVADLVAGECRPLPDGLGFQAGNGFLTERNAVALGFAIAWLIQNRESARGMGEIGRAFVRERFAANRLVQEMTGLYHQLIGADPILSREQEFPQISAASSADQIV